MLEIVAVQGLNLLEHPANILRIEMLSTGASPHGYRVSAFFCHEHPRFRTALY